MTIKYENTGNIVTKEGVLLLRKNVTFAPIGGILGKMYNKENYFE